MNQRRPKWGGSWIVGQYSPAREAGGPIQGGVDAEGARRSVAARRRAEAAARVFLGVCAVEWGKISCTCI